MPGLLYGVGLSQPTRSCLLLIKEANLDVEFKRVNMMAGEHKQAPYITEVNPAGQVPAYVEGDLKLAEGSAIIIYLAESNNLSEWYPTDPKARAKVNQWMYWHQTGTRKSARNVFAPTLFGVGNVDTTEFATSLTLLESVLGSSKFVASSDHPTVVDLMILPELDQLKMDFFGTELFDYSPYPNVVRYMADLEAILPSYAENKQNAINILKMIQSSGFKK